MRLYARVKGGKYQWEETINGRRYRMSTGVRDKEAAKKIASKQVSLISENRWLEKSQPASHVAVSELLDRVKRTYELDGKASSQNLSLLKRARAAFGARMADELTADQLSAYVEKRKAEGYAAATINRTTEILRHAYRLAKISPPDITRLEENNARQGFFTRAEFDAVLSHLPADLRDFCFFAFLTGMRLGEIKSLAWSNVSENTIRLSGVDAKTRKPRTIVATGELSDLLQRRQAARAVKSEEGAAAVMAGTIFHRDGAPVGEFDKSWASACAAAGVGKMICPKCDGEGTTNKCTHCEVPTRYRGRIFHDLRRSGVRNLIRAGVPQNIAMRISGHRTDATFRRYDICNEEDLAQAMVSLQKYHLAEAAKVAVISAK